MIRFGMGYARNSPFNKPLHKWTEKQRKWLDTIYQCLFPDLSTLRHKHFPRSNQRLYFSRSTRGRNREMMAVLDRLFFEREMMAVRPAYREFSKRLASPSFPDSELGKSKRREFDNAMKRKFISACQRRVNELQATRLPPPPKD